MLLQSCAYYLGCNARNRIRVIAKRMRQPKYLFGMLAIGFYLWFFLFNNRLSDRKGSGGIDQEFALSALSLMALLQVAVGWFASGRGIGFREPEVQFLFPRPFSRFQLLLFKWLTAQFALIISSLIVALFFVRWGTLSYFNVAVGFWLLQAVVASHALLYGLLTSRLRKRIRFLPACLILATVPICMVLTWQKFDGEFEWSALKEIAETAPLSTLLAPFELLVKPVTTLTASEFIKAALAPLAILSLHWIVIWRANLPFEERAIATAAKIQNVMKHGLRGLRSKKKMIVAKPGSPWNLAAEGAVWKALVWKNVISITRFSRTTLLRLTGLLFVLAYLLNQFGGDLFGGVGATRVGFGLLVILGYFSLLGPHIIRVDLRIDIPHFDVLKSMPIRARSLIFGEVMGTVVVLWSVQVVICVVAAILLVEEEEVVFSWAMKGPALPALLVALFALDFVLLTAENLLALWMPGFIRLGRGVKPGFDQMGPYIIGALMRFLAILILIVPSALLGTGVGYLAQWLGSQTVLAVAMGVASGSVLLILEGLGMIQLSEKRYNRFDISSENVRVDS